MDWNPIPVERQSARDAATKAAFKTEEGELMLHSFAHTGSIALGADTLLESVLDDIDNADELVWVPHPLKHDLAVRRAGAVRYYQVSSPERDA